MTYRKKVVWLIFDQNQQILVWKYSEHYTNDTNLHRTFPGGGKEEWESYQSTLYKEIYEEVNIHKKNLTLIHKCKRDYYQRYNSYKKKRISISKGNKFQWKRQRLFILYFHGNKKSIHLNNCNELSEYKRITINQLQEYISPQLTNFLIKKGIIQLITQYISHLTSTQHDDSCQHAS